MPKTNPSRTNPSITNSSITYLPPPGQRVIATSELARFETCPLAWWYDRVHPLAHASAREIARRQRIMEAVYGPGVARLPEYQMLAHLAERALAAPALAAAPPADIAPEAPRALMTLALAAGGIIIGLALAGVAFALWHP